MLDNKTQLALELVTHPPAGMSDSLKDKAWKVIEAALDAQPISAGTALVDRPVWWHNSLPTPVSPVSTTVMPQPVTMTSTVKSL